MHLWLLKKTKQLKKFLLIFFWDANAAIFDLNLKESIVDPHSDIDLSILSELKSIAL